MITQAVLILQERRAVLFCRQNALYISYIKGNTPAEPMFIQNGIVPGFNICPQNDGFAVFFKREDGAALAVKITASGIFRLKAEGSILNVSADDVFLFNGIKNETVFSKNGAAYSLGSGERLFQFEKNGILRTVFLNNGAFTVFTNNSALYMYGALSKIVYELYKAAENVEDFSLCSANGTVYLALLVKNGASYEVVYKTAGEQGVSKGVSIIKTSAAQNVFIYAVNGRIRVMVSTESGKVFYRETEPHKTSFTPAESIDTEGTAKIYCFDKRGDKKACCDVMCSMDGTVIYPKEEKGAYKTDSGNDKEDKNRRYKEAMAQKDRIIQSLNMRINQMQDSSEAALKELKEKLEEQMKINNAISAQYTAARAEAEIYGPARYGIKDMSGDCTVYITSSRVIEGVKDEGKEKYIAEE